MARPPPEDEVFLDEPWASVWWDSSRHCVHTEWKAFASTTEFRAALMRALDAIREKKAIAYVGDGRKVKVIVQEDQKWVSEVWVPLARAAGLKRAAIVTAPTGLGKVTVDEAVKMVDDRGVLMHTFESVAAAHSWIAEIG